MIIFHRVSGAVHSQCFRDFIAARSDEVKARLNRAGGSEAETRLGQGGVWGKARLKSGKCGIFLESGLTKRKSMVYLCSNSPWAGRLGAGVLKKSQKNQIFDLTNGKSMLYFILTPLKAEMVSRRCWKNFEKNWEIDLTKWKSVLNYIPIAPDEGDDDCKSKWSLKIE